MGKVCTGLQRCSAKLAKPVLAEPPPRRRASRRRQVSQPVGIPWPLAFLLSRWLGGRVPHPVPNSSSGRLSGSQGANRAWSGHRQITASLPDALDGGRPGG